jgi:UDP-N-acetylmuramoylalanine-D-glutamate ligase
MARIDSMGIDFARLWFAKQIRTITGSTCTRTATSSLAQISNGIGWPGFAAANIGRSLSDLVAAETFEGEFVLETSRNITFLSAAVV